MDSQRPPVPGCCGVSCPQDSGEGAGSCHPRGCGQWGGAAGTQVAPPTPGWDPRAPHLLSGLPEGGRVLNRRPCRQDEDSALQGLQNKGFESSPRGNTQLGSSSQGLAFASTTTPSRSRAPRCQSTSKPAHAGHSPHMCKCWQGDKRGIRREDLAQTAGGDGYGLNCAWQRAPCPRSSWTK